MPGSRIAVEVTGSSASLQAATTKAADALKSLGDILKRQTDVALNLGDRTVKANQIVGRSYQTMAREAGLASDQTIRAFERQGAVILDSSRQQQVALGKTGETAKASAGTQARASEQAANASRRAADTHVQSARRTEQAFGSASSSITRAGKVITLGLVGAAAASVDLAVKFQANTLRMQTQAGATAGQLQKLRKGILDMAGNVGFSPNQLADALYHVVSSMDKMLPAAQRASGELKVLETSAKLAQIGHSNLEETTYALASAMNALHAPISDTNKIAGEMNSIIGAGDMTLNDLLDSLKSGLIPTAQTFGVSFQSVGAALAVMGDMGMRGALAGTRLRMSLSLLGAPSEKAAKLLEAIGMKSGDVISSQKKMADLLQKSGLSITTLSDDMRKPNGILVALADMRDHMVRNGLSAQAAAALISDALGGGRSAAAIQTLSHNLDRVDVKFKQIGGGAKQFGADWQKQGQTTAQQLHNLEGGMLSLGTSIGTNLLPYVEKGVHDFTDLVHWFERGSGAAHALEAGIGTLATVAIGSYLVKNLISATKLMREFGQVLWNPLGAVKGFGAASRPTGLAGGGGGGGLATVATRGGGGISGARGFIAPGSIANPIVVAMEAGEFAGLSSMGAQGTVANEMGAAKAEAGVAQAAGGAVPVVGGAAGAERTATAGVLASMRSTVGEITNRLMRGGLIAGGGLLAGQVASSAIGGGTGQRVGKVIDYAAIGAGLGSVIGPEGTIVGMLAGGLLGGVKEFIGHDATAEGKDFANKFTANIPGAMHSRVGEALAKATTDQINVTNHIRQLTNPNQAFGASAAEKQQAGQLATQQFRAFFNQGYTAGKAVVQGLQSVKIPTTVEFLNDFQMKLAALPARARPEAAKVMLSYAQGLQQNGRLPKGAVNTMIQSLEAMFPGLRVAFQQAGMQSSAALGAAMKFDAAKSNLTTTLNDVRGQYGIWVGETKITGQHIWQDMGAAMQQLHYIVNTTTGQTKDDALKSLGQLRTQAVSYFTDMGQQVAAKASDMKIAVATGSQAAYKIGAQNFGNLQVSIAKAMQAGVIAAQQGVQLITNALNQTLTALGEKPLDAITVKKLGPDVLQALASGQVSSGAISSPHDHGGYIGNPGEKGRDTVPIVVGRGEAVLNHPQQQIVNQFVPGGLDAVYAATAGTKHWMAGGGFAGYSLPLPRSEMLPGSWSFDQGIDIPAPAGTPEFAVGPGVITQEGISGFGPNAPILRVTAGPLAGMSFYYGHAGPDLVRVGQAVRAGQQISEVGAGRVGISSGPHIEFGFWPPRGGAAVAPLLRQLMGGAGVTGVGGAGGGAPLIPVPQVTGKGAVADIVRGGLGKVTAAANAYAQAHMLALGAAGVSGFGSPGTAGTVGNAQAAAVIQQALALTGVTQNTGAWTSMLLRQISRESSFNPNAINRTDINAQRGDPSRGWLQLTGSNFAQYAMPGHNTNIYDPLSNTIAAIRYIEGRYGGEATGLAFMIANGGGAYGTGGYAHAATGHKPPKAIPTGMTTKDLQGLSAVGGKVNTMETVIAHLSGRYTADTTLFGPQEAEARYLNPDGSLNPEGYARKIADDRTLLGIDQQLLELYRGEAPIVSGALNKWLGKQSTTDATIRRNKTTLATNKIREASIRKAILDLQKPTRSQVTALESTIAATKHQYDTGIHVAEGNLSHFDTGKATREAALRTAVLHAEQAGGDPAARRLASAVLSAEHAKAGYTGHDKNIRQRLAHAVTAAELRYRSYTQSHPSKNAALTAARQQLSSYEIGATTSRASLTAALQTARSDEQNALDPLQGALIGARRAQTDRKFRISTEVFHLREQLARLSKQDAKLTGTDTALQAILSGANNAGAAGTASGVNATVTQLETIAAGLGMVNWKGGKFAGIDTTMPGAIVTEIADIQSLKNDIVQATVNAGAAAGAATPADNSQLVSLLEQQNLQLAQTLALNQAQTRALTSIIPEIPAYDRGGPVIGDQLARLHDEEYVVPRGGALVTGGGSGGTQHIVLEQHYHGDARGLMNFVDQRVRHPDNVRVVSRTIGQRTSQLSGSAWR